jgi:hypothetical protein
MFLIVEGIHFNFWAAFVTFFEIEFSSFLEFFKSFKISFSGFVLNNQMTLHHGFFDWGDFIDDKSCIFFEEFSGEVEFNDIFLDKNGWLL